MDRKKFLASLGALGLAPFVVKGLDRYETKEPVYNKKPKRKIIVGEEQKIVVGESGHEVITPRLNTNNYAGSVQCNLFYDKELIGEGKLLSIEQSNNYIEIRSDDYISSFGERRYANGLKLVNVEIEITMYTTLLLEKYQTATPINVSTIHDDFTVEFDMYITEVIDTTSLDGRFMNVKGTISGQVLVT